LRESGNFVSRPGVCSAPPRAQPIPTNDFAGSFPEQMFPLLIDAAVTANFR
jgi:hypothetical protein